MKPTELEFQAENPVPGSGVTENMYDLINAASWISSHESNLKNRIKKMRELPTLIRDLPTETSLV